MNTFPHLTRLEAGACRTALCKMLDHTGVFYVSDFTKLCEVARVIPGSRDLNALRLLHCVRWSDMDRVTRDEARAAILRALQVPTEISAAFVTAFEDPAPQKVSVFRRLIGGAS